MAGKNKEKISAHSREEFAALQAELESYRQEKENIRAVIGEIGGNQDRKRDRLLNISFVTMLLTLLTSDLIGHFWPEYKILPFQLSIEFGVLLVSIKIIWMMHKQAKVEHFQFWILNSIEFRLTSLSHKLDDIKKEVDGKNGRSD